MKSKNRKTKSRKKKMFLDFIGLFLCCIFARKHSELC